MQPQAYREMDRNEAEHWWYVGRRRVLGAVLSTLELEPSARILEVGSGTGGNLELLSRFGRVTAWEPNELARELSATKNRALIEADRLEQSTWAPTGSFDLICLLDVVEHLDDPVAALGQLSRQLSERGRFLITVPAYQWMWSAHDTLHEHRRRYSRALLQSQLTDAGLTVQRLGNFNCLLFPAAMLARAVDKLRSVTGLGAGRPSVGMSMPSPLLNRLLTTVFSAEAKRVARGGYPFGLSLLAISSRR